MIRRDLTYPTADGDAPARLFLPDGARDAPLVLFFMDAFGLRPALDEMAAALVADGFAVVQPDLYWRSGPFAPFDARTAFSDPPERARIYALMNAVHPPAVVADAAALLDALAGDPAVHVGQVHLLGYCMGGRQALFAAAGLGARCATMASIHGGGLVRPDPSSPHLGAPHIAARLYFAVADQDGSCTAEDCEVLGAALADAGVAHEIELYPGARHGFAVPDSAVYDADAAARHHARVVALFAGS